MFQDLDRSLIPTAPLTVAVETKKERIDGPSSQRDCQP
jgi:hypothetical protein